MKQKLLGITLSLFAASGAFAQTPAPTNNQPKEDATTIVFVPGKLLDENRIAGKLKENTFYWTNPLGNLKDGPKGVAEDGKQFLRIKGCGTNTTPESDTMMTVTRVYNIPANTQSATAHVTVRYKYDEWTDINPTSKFGSVGYSLVKDGLEIRKNSYFVVTSGGPPQLVMNNQWQTTHFNIGIAKGAQQLTISIKAELSSTIDIKSLSVTFTPADAPKAP